MHIALVCEDVVREITSYLPTSNVLSVVGCGAKRINDILHKNVEYCLVKSRRDMNVVYVYMKLFPYIRYVYAKGMYVFGGKKEYIMPKYIEKFIARKSDIINLKFGPRVSYIVVNQSIECEFEEYPETSIVLHCYCHDDDRESSWYDTDSHVTHTYVDYLQNDIMLHTDDEYELLYPRLKQITMRECPSSYNIRVSKRVEINCVCTYAHNKVVCDRCSIKNNTVIIDSHYQDADFTQFDGVKTMRVNNIADRYDISSMPSSIKTLHILYRHPHNLDTIPKTIINITLPIMYINYTLLAMLSHVKKLHIIRCNTDPDDVIDIISECNELQIGTIIVEFSSDIMVANSLAMKNYNSVCTNRYYVSYNNAQNKPGSSIIFERIR